MPHLHLPEAAADLRSAERFLDHGLVGRSAPMLALYRRVERVAASRATVFVIGETGTGKEAVARAIHRVGGPASAPFVAVNCAAITRELMESELFGHLRGSFSGAVADSPGLVRAAHGGTLFLDEVTEMSAEAQAKLLRVLEERRVRPVGAIAETEVDVRFVASTNRDPREAVAAGVLREDLFHRLHVQAIRVPALRERPGDLDLLVRHFVARLAPLYGRVVTDVEDAAFGALLNHRWPGNVRELRNAVESALSVGDGAVLRAEDLPPELLHVEGPSGTPSADAGARDATDASAAAPDAELRTFDDAERALVSQALAASNGNKSEASRRLGISRKRLYAKLRRFRSVPARSAPEGGGRCRSGTPVSGRHTFAASI